MGFISGMIGVSRALMLKGFVAFDDSKVGKRPWDSGES